MTKELREKLDALRAAAPKLNQATDKATAVVETVERFLEELSLGIPARSRVFEERRYTTEDDEKRSDDSCLAYGRIGGRGRFRIHVLTTTYRENPSPMCAGDEWEEIDQDRTPWSSCPREIKLEAFDLLPELLDQIASKAEELASKTEKTAASVDEMLATLKTEVPTASQQEGTPGREPAVTADGAMGGFIAGVVEEAQKRGKN